METLRKKAAIVGISSQDLGRQVIGKTAMRMKIEASVAAIHDAGLQKKDIDGFITSEGGGSAGGNPRTHMEFAEHMGIMNKPLCMSLPVGGGTSGLSLAIARWAVLSGACNNVLIVSGSNAITERGRSAVGSATTDWYATFPGHSVTYEQPFGPLILTYYSVMAMRHMYEFGTTPEQLAAVAVACRKHAALNPEAIMRNPITIDDVINSRWISTPFHLLDCCLNSDGAAAFVVTSAENARNCPKPPVWVLGLGHNRSAYFMGDLTRPIPEKTLGLTRTVGRMAARDAFNEAGVERSDIDFAQLYDNFTINPIYQFEDFGFCAKGEGGPFVEGGRIELGGELPLNTFGGMLSCSFGPAGYLHWVEAVRQLRGEAGDRQVKDARLGIVCAVAGVISTFGGVGILAKD